VRGHPSAGGLLVVAEEPVHLRPLLAHAGEDLLLLAWIQLSQDVGRVVVVQLADDRRRTSGVESRQGLRCVSLLRHLRQRLTGQLSR
jgi:hypothetical protein